MLFIEDKWVDEFKDNELINLFYNVYNLSRRILCDYDTYINEGIVLKESFKLFKKKPKFKEGTIAVINMPKEETTKVQLNIDLDIISSYYRKILEKYNPKNITELSEFLKLVDEFVDFNLFLQKYFRYFTRFYNNTNEFIITDGETGKDIDIKDRLYHINIKLTSITNLNRSSGSIILDMMDNIDKYITIYTVSEPARNISYRYISDENPKMSFEEKMFISQVSDYIMNQMYTTIKKSIEAILKFPTDKDKNIISDDLARGKLYATISKRE